MLIDFLSKYVHLKSVRTAYTRDPYKTLQEHGVTKAQLAAVAKDGVEATVAAEVRLIVSRDDRLRPFGWGTLMMQVSGFDPQSIAKGQSFKLTVYGAEFTKDTQVAVKGGSRGTLFTAKSTQFVNSGELVGTMRALTESDTYSVGAYYAQDDEKYGNWTEDFLNVVEPSAASARGKKSSGKPSAAKALADKSTTRQRRTKRPTAKKPRTPKKQP